MKKAILILAAIAMTASAVHARVAEAVVKVTGIEMKHAESRVEINFHMAVGQKAAAGRHNLVLTPVLRGGGQECELPQIVVRGRKAGVIEARHALASDHNRYCYGSFETVNGGSVSYSAQVPYEAWMTGAELFIGGVSVACCSAQEANVGLIASNVLYAEPQTETEIIPVALPSESTGDLLSRQYTFISHMSELDKASDGGKLFDYNMPLNMGGGSQMAVEKFIDESREGSITIYFAQGSTSVDRGLYGNNKSLVELISVVRALTASQDSKVARIVVAGFASPEGTQAVNERLAGQRADAIVDFLLANSGVDGRLISLYNGGPDWYGLREMVATSDLPDKHAVTDIIDNTPVWAVQGADRLSKLKALSGGRTYNYMLRNYFPQLRQAAFIRVYYTNEQ